MKPFFFSFCAALLLAGCSSVDPQKYWAQSEPVGGAAAENGKNNVARSPYYKAPDFYRSSPSKTLILLPKFKTLQQSTEYSDGAVCVKMVLTYYGIPCPGERELAARLDTRTPECPRWDGGIGALPSAIAAIFEQYGCKVLPRRTFESCEEFAVFAKKQLKSGNPVLLENITWGGHWQVLIGYDDMGTPTPSDDVLILADPYDTTDHQQDGYAIRPAERFFYEWFDAGALGNQLQEELYVAPVRP